MREAFYGMLVGIVLGLAAYHWLIRVPPAPTTETYRPGHVQKDGSVDLARIPTAPADAGPPPHVLPKGATETSRAHLVVTPKRHEPQTVDAATSGSREADTGCSCDAITIDLSHYTSPGGTGIIASSSDAEVDVHESTYTPMLDPAPRLDRFVHVTVEPGSEAYAAAVGKRFLQGRVGISIGGSKRPGDGARPILGVEWSW